MKIKIFTHSDRDGIGCIILGKLAFGENLEYEVCNYNDVDERVQNFIHDKESDTYDKVFITDISVNEDVSSRIDSLFGKTNVFTLLDHHPTALNLNKYNWAKVEIMLNKSEKTSGTRMFYDWLIDNNYLYEKGKYDALYEFVEDTRKYDTWQWNAENDLIPKKWNDIFYILGRDRFINKIVEDHVKPNKFEFTETDKLLLELEQQKIDRYIIGKDKQIIVKDILGYKSGVIFGEQYHSELGNRLCELHPELDFIVIVNLSNAVSYRATKDDIDLGKEIASIYGGGGHPKSSGSPINDEIRNKVLNMIFDEK